MTTSIDLTEVWIHEAADPSNAHWFFTSRPEDQRQRPGEVREYGGGRLRVVTVGARRWSQSVTLVDVTTEQLEWLDELAGEIVMYRDRYRLRFCTFFSLPPLEHKTEGFAVTLDLVEATFLVEV